MRSNLTLIWKSKGRGRIHWIALAAVVLSAFVLYNYNNLVGANWFYHVDEHEYYVIGKNLLETGSLKRVEPYNNLIPTPAFTPVDAETIDGATVPRRAYGMYFLTAAGLVFGERGPFFLVPIFGIAVLLFAYLFTRRLFGPNIALLATGLSGVSFPLVYWSNSLFPNVPVLAFFLAGVYFLLRAGTAEQRRWLYHIVTAMSFAAATWIRYECVVFIAVLTVPTIFLKRREYQPKKVAVALVVYLLLLTPIALLNIQNYGSALAIGYTTSAPAAGTSTVEATDAFSSALSKIAAVGRLLTSSSRDWEQGWQNSLDWFFGLYPVLIIAGFGGLGYTISKEREARPFAIGFALLIVIWTPYVLSNSLWGEGTNWYGNSYVRYMLPVWVALTLFSAVALAKIYHQPNKWISGPVVLALLGIILWQNIDYTVGKQVGLVNSVVERQFSDQVLKLGTNVPKDGVIVATQYVSRSLIDQHVLDLTYLTRDYTCREYGACDLSTAMKNETPEAVLWERETSINYVNLLLDQNVPVYLIESPWNSASNLDLESALLRNPALKTQTVATLASTKNTPEVRLVSVAKRDLKPFGRLLEELGIADTRGNDPLPMTPAEASDLEILRFWNKRSDIVGYFALNGWDASPSNFRLILIEWWKTTEERFY